ncbi:MAG TPA: hypothetical protein GX701_01075 [Clostridiales bacterium]|nr:hypothetical protein [Clostridiales bacterium]
MISKPKMAIIALIAVILIAAILAGCSQTGENRENLSSENSAAYIDIKPFG